MHYTVVHTNIPRISRHIWLTQTSIWIALKTYWRENKLTWLWYGNKVSENENCINEPVVLLSLISQQTVKLSSEERKAAAVCSVLNRRSVTQEKAEVVEGNIAAEESCQLFATRQLWGT